MTKSQKKIVPITVWLKASLLTGLFFWGGYLFFLLHDKKISKSYKPDTQIVTNVGSINQKSDYYFLGSSLTKQGLCTFHSLDSASKRKNLLLNYKVTYKPWADVSDFSFMLSELYIIKPKYLFIESNALCVDMRRSYSFLTKYSIHLSRISENLSSNLSLSNLFSGSNSKQNRSIINSTNKLDINYWNIYRVRVNNYKIRSFNEFPQWSQFFRKAKNAGIQVFILEFPRSIEAQTYISRNFQDNYKALIKQYQKIYGIKYIEFPYKIEQEKYFEDAAHLNKTGADLFSNWLTDVLQKKIIKSQQ